VAAIAVYSLKGGVGKTTLAVNLAWCAATLSARRTLLWDLDPQAAATYLLPGAKPAKGAAQAIFSKDVDAAKVTRATDIARLDLIGADASLRGLDLLFHELDKKKRLARLLDGLTREYDRVILDCPPGLTETSEQVMRAASLIVVPVIPSPLSVRAFEEVKAHLGRRGSAPLVLPVLPVHMMVDRRRALHAASAIEQMTVRRKPVGAYAPRSPGTTAFAEVWRAIERRLAAP
jgi:cellulose biosynthesis protein BcsQ